MPDTHVVTNQVPPLENYNPATSPVLTEALIREGGEWGLDEVTELGALSGSARAQRWGELADRNQPVLRTHDRYGHRVDEVEYDPAYHELMKVAIGHGLHAAPWADDRPGSHVVRAAKTSVWTPEPGHICPISMTYAVVPALRNNPELAASYEPLLVSRDYDPELKVPATKVGITAGMSMTEKQGGSDVRAGTTQATRNGDGTYSLTGHKWFTSAPMCDIFLVLAQAPSGLSCFFLPRILPDGNRNRMFLQRLKDKLGNHANASSEVEYDGATAWLVGEEGRGVPTIIEMVNLTRLDCTLGSATSMRTGMTRAIHHAQHRKAFGDYLIDQPLMRNVLADLAVEAEAATIVAMRMAGATDAAVRGDERETLLRRIGLAASKYWVCKRATPHAAEAMECLGGNGYVEESGMPRLYREAPLMGIWRGPATSARSTRCAPWQLGRNVSTCCSTSWPRRRAMIRGSTPTSARSSRRWRISRPSSTAPARSPRTSASRCRARCWSATATQRSPRRSWPLAWAVRGAARLEPCPPAWISRRSSNVRSSRDDVLLGLSPRIPNSSHRGGRSRELRFTVRRPPIGEVSPVRSPPARRRCCVQH